MPDVPNLAFGTWCSNVDVPKALSGFMQSAQLSRIQLWDVVTRWQNPESGFRDISMLSKVPKVTFGIPFGTSLHLGVTPILVVFAPLGVLRASSRMRERSERLTMTCAVLCDCR